MSDPQPGSRRPWRTDAEWQRLHHRLDHAATEGPALRPWGRYAGTLAAASVIGVASYLGLRFTTQRTPAWRTISTPVASRATVRLGDSTVVTLGPATTMRYLLTASRREIQLDGLADFRVTHNASRPFIVRARNAVTTDLGTEFVVRAYDSDSMVTVSVTAGSVRLLGADDAAAATLAAGEVGSVTRTGLASAVPGALAITGRSWVYGSLYFRDQALDDVVRELGRWFDVDIRIRDSVLARQHVTAAYATPTLEGVLDAIGATTGAHYARSGRTITLRRGAR